MKKIVCGLALATLTAGCASVGGPGASSYYDCGNGQVLKVDYIGNSTALVGWNNQQPVALNQEPSASGVRYMNAQYTLHTKGNEASWTVGRMAPMTCRSVAIPR